MADEMTATNHPNLVVERKTLDALLVRLSGNWREHAEPPGAGNIQEALDRFAEVKSLSFESSGLVAWDSRFVVLIRNCSEMCRARNIELHGDGLPEGVRRLLRLAEAVPERKGARCLAGAVVRELA